MLEIDYDLIPLADATRAGIAAKAGQLARRGRVPPVAPSAHGRVVVVNPNQGYAINHVPDDLRRPLRRVMLPVHAGARPLSGRDVLEALREGGAETLYQLVVELHSDFPSVASFAQLLPPFRRENPLCRVLLHGDMARIFMLLEELVAQQGAVCALHFDHVERPLLLRKAADLEVVLATLPRYPTFTTPFFSHLRLRVGQEAALFTVAEMKRLYPFFGVGHIEELDVTGQLRERLIVVDIPLSAIEAVQFAPRRGESFQAVRAFEEKMFSQAFAEKGLEGKEIPWSEVQAFYRRLPGREEEEILLERVRALRVNCFEGHVSFLWTPQENYLPLYEVRKIEVFWPSGNTEPPPLEALRSQSPSLVIDGVVLTEENRPRFGDVRAAIRRNFLGYLFTSNLERQAKLQSHAAQLKVACLGPLAAQIFRLLQPFGLAQVLPVERVYYLCDSFDQIETYQDHGQRLQARYDQLVDLLSGLFADTENPAVPADLILNRMPVIREWTLDRPPAFRELKVDLVDSVYTELQVFIKFCEAEFRRVGRAPPGENFYFDRLNQCHEAALYAKQLANLMSGRYGNFLAADASPDFVFFGGKDERELNDQQFFLPGLAWADFFSQSENQALFQEDDFAFSIFFEEQVNALTYLQTQDEPEVSREEFSDRYFADRLKGASRELEELLAISTGGTAGDNPVFDKISEQLEQEHRAERDELQQQNDFAADELNAIEVRYFEALRNVQEFLDDGDLDPADLIAGSDYIRGLDSLLVGKSVEELKKLVAVMRQNVRYANEVTRGKTEPLGAYLQAFGTLQRTQLALVHADHIESSRDQYAAALPRLLAQLNELHQLDPETAHTRAENLMKLRRVAMEEKRKIDERQQELVQNIQEKTAAIRHGIRNLGSYLNQPLREAEGEVSPAEMVDRIAERLDNAEREVGTIVAAGEAMRETENAFELHYRRKRENNLALYRNSNELTVLREVRERSRLQRMMGKKLTELPMPPPELPPAQDAARLRAAYEKNQQTCRTLAIQLMDFGQKTERLEELRAALRKYQEFQEVYLRFRAAVKEKMASQRAVAQIGQRHRLLKREADQLPRLIEEQLFPAYQKLCEEHFIPRAKKRISAFRQASALVREFSRIPFNELKTTFLERGIFKRFHAVQFRNGARFGINASHPLFTKLSNVSPALAAFHRIAEINLAPHLPPGAEVVLERLPAASPEEILRFCELQRDLPETGRRTYLVLPGTLPLARALELIVLKNAIFRGLPQLPMIFISKYDISLLREQEELRQRYFVAVRHNVLINIDDVRLVDNPNAITNRVVQETLGASFDLERLRLPTEKAEPDSKGSAS